tara:strand:- start:1229 stop:1852 length:624 start_codon:yes stop_codon:yes gene_type:complete
MKFSDITPYIRPEVSGAPNVLIERAIRDTTIDFCRRTDVYLAEPEFVSIVANVNEYAVTIPAGTELNHILDIFNDKTALKPVSYGVLLQNLGDETETGSPKMYAQRDNKEFFLAPIPSATDSLRVLFSLKPTSSSTSIPDTIGKEYRETITLGALYRLQMMSGYAFSNPSTAVANLGLYERQVGRTVRQVKYGFSGGSLTAKRREFL